MPTLIANLRPEKEGRFSRGHIISLGLTMGMEMGAIQKYVLSTYVYDELYVKSSEISMQGKNLTCYSSNC